MSTLPKSTGEKAVALLRRVVEEYIGDSAIYQEFSGFYKCAFCDVEAPNIHSSEGMEHKPDCWIDNANKVLSEQ